MVKTVLLLLLAILLISLLRSAIGIVMKGFASLAQPQTPSRRSPGTVNAGELKRDPVCGVYVPAATAVKRTVKGATVHFCSEKCAARYSG